MGKQSSTLLLNHPRRIQHSYRVKQISCVLDCMLLGQYSSALYSQICHRLGGTDIPGTLESGESTSLHCSESLKLISAEFECEISISLAY